ncbi:MAG: tetratricopeptide repeat protein [Leptospira sp.]|nr:tetratricopeptide repeat protein [Leptospira sp.]
MYRNHLLKILFLILFLLPWKRIFALNLEEVWNLLQSSKERYQLQDKSPETNLFRFGFEAPQTFTKEAVSHEVFQFCHKYLEKFHPQYKTTKYRDQIRLQVAEFYGDQIFQNLFGRSTITCHSNKSPELGYIRIDFYSNREYFLPFKWDHINKEGYLHLSEEDESKNGRKESFTLYSAPNCIKEVMKDRNGFGGIDEWWSYEKCNLSKIEYDENENGYKERICYYENGKQSYCQGIGEKEEKDARIALMLGDNETALILFKKAHTEIKKEFSQNSFKSCLLLKEIVALDFQKQDYNSFRTHLDEFLGIAQCEKSSLEILIYKGYYQLYLSKEYKLAKITYRKAAIEYFKMNGEENPELVLNLSLAEYLDKDPLACLSTLDRLRERRLEYSARFFFFYYRASCNQLISKHDISIEDLKKALIKSRDDAYHPLIHFKIATAYYNLDRKEEGTAYLITALKKDISLTGQILTDPLFTEFLESNVGKSFLSKYYLNQKQK